MRKPFNHDPDAFTKAREAAGLTMTALARELGCSLSLISEIEGGTRNCRRSLLERAAKVLGVPVAQLERKREPARETTTAAAVDMPEVRHEERAETRQLPELRGEPVVEREAS